jgi:hypothetical protein
MSPNVHWNLQVISQDELYSVTWLVTPYDAHVSKGEMNKQVVLKIIKGVNHNWHAVLVEPWVTTLSLTWGMYVFNQSQNCDKTPK